MTKNNSYRYLLLIIAILITLTAFASTDDTVEIMAIGYGNTLEEATDNAIKHSLELATGILVRSYSSLDSSLTIDASGLVYTEEFKENILTVSRAYLKDYENCECKAQSTRSHDAKEQNRYKRLSGRQIACTLRSKYTDRGKRSETH